MWRWCWHWFVRSCLLSCNLFSHLRAIAVASQHYLLIHSIHEQLVFCVARALSAYSFQHYLLIIGLSVAISFLALFMLLVFCCCCCCRCCCGCVCVCCFVLLLLLVLLLQAVVCLSFFFCCCCCCCVAPAPHVIAFAFFGGDHEPHIEYGKQQQ